MTRCLFNAADASGVTAAAAVTAVVVAAAATAVVAALVALAVLAASSFKTWAQFYANRAHHSEILVANIAAGISLCL